MIAFLLRLYPAAWRVRYGDEFAALLAERPIGPFDVADVLLGAVDAHLTRRGVRATPSQPRGFVMSLRVGGLAAMAGSLLWFAGWSISAFSGDDRNVPASTMLVAGTVALLIALVGLSAFQARRHPLLVWAAFAVPAAGNAVALLGIVGMAFVGDRPFIGDATPWAVWMVGFVATLAGSALFGVATFRTAALSPRASVLLGVGASAVLVIGMVGLPWIMPVGAELVPQLVTVGLYAGGWFWLGLDAVRRSDGRGPTVAVQVP